MNYKPYAFFLLSGLSLTLFSCNPSNVKKKSSGDKGSYLSSMYTNAGDDNIYQSVITSPNIGNEEQKAIEQETDKVVGGTSTSLPNQAGQEAAASSSIEVNQISSSQVDMSLFPKCAIAMMPFKSNPQIGETVSLSVSCNTDATKKMIYSWYDEKNIKLGEGKTLVVKGIAAGKKQYKAYSSYMHTTAQGYTQVEVISLSWGSSTVTGEANYIFGKSGNTAFYSCLTPNKTPLSEHSKVFALPSCTFNDPSEYLTGWTVNGKKVSNNPQEIEKELQMGLNQLFPITNKEVYKSPFNTFKNSIAIGLHPIHKLEGDYSQLFLDVLYSPEFSSCGTYNYDQDSKSLKYCIISQTLDRIQLIYINGKPLNNVKVIFNGKYVTQGNSQVSLNPLQGTITLQKGALTKKSTLQIEAQRASDGAIIRSNLLILEK